MQVPAVTSEPLSADDIAAICRYGRVTIGEGCIRAGREGGYAHAHCAFTEHYSCLTDIDTRQVTHVLCVHVTGEFSFF
jgi:hypothetical protein